MDRICIHCPVCHTKSADAAIYELEFSFSGVPIGRECFVRCELCGSESMLVGYEGDPATASSDELSRHLVRPASTKERLLAVIALTLCWLPLLGLWLSQTAQRRLRTTHGVCKCASFVALWVSVLSTSSLLMAIVIVPIMLLIEFR